MSGLLDSIARRRRASSEDSSYLEPGAPGAPSANGSHGSALGAESRNGAGPPAHPPAGPSHATPATTPEPEVAQNESDAAEAPGFRDRGQLRRRARYLRQLREIQLRDLGGFELELHRFGRERRDLVQAKVAVASATDRELRALELALAEGHSVRELREAGIGGACLECGAVHGSADRFCAACGIPLEQPELAIDQHASVEPEPASPARSPHPAPASHTAPAELGAGSALPAS